jgi:glutamine---fructose-6-phosphate transaminase (isomerizing)
MRQTVDSQAGALAGILADEAPVIAAAERLCGRRVLAIGTGTSWHAAGQAAALLRAAGLDAGAAQSADAAVDGPLPGQDGALLVFTHADHALVPLPAEFPVTCWRDNPAAPASRRRHITC